LDVCFGAKEKEFFIFLLDRNVNLLENKQITSWGILLKSTFSEHDIPPHHPELLSVGRENEGKKMSLGEGWRTGIVLMFVFVCH